MSCRRQVVFSDGLQLLVRNIQNLLDQFLFLLQGPGHLFVFPSELLDGSEDWLSQEDLVAGVDRHLGWVDQFPGDTKVRSEGGREGGREREGERERGREGKRERGKEGKREKETELYL